MILLNYDFKMEYLLLEKSGHADSLSRLIPKYSDPLEGIVIATLKIEDKIVKYILCSIVCELPVMLEEMKIKTEMDKFIKKKEKIKR